MLYTNRGWTKIPGEDKIVITHMLIVTSDQDNEWNIMTALFPQISKIIELNHLTHAASINIGAELLTIALHHYQDEYFPDDITKVQDELSNLILPKI